jgi:hypothetical protein
MIRETLEGQQHDYLVNRPHGFREYTRLREIQKGAINRTQLAQVSID